MDARHSAASWEAMRAINVTNSCSFLSFRCRGNKEYSTAGKTPRRAPLRKTHKHRHNHERQVMRIGDQFRTIAHIQTHAHIYKHNCPGGREAFLSCQPPLLLSFLTRRATQNTDTDTKHCTTQAQEAVKGRTRVRLPHNHRDSITESVVAIRRKDVIDSSSPLSTSSFTRNLKLAVYVLKSSTPPSGMGIRILPLSRRPSVSTWILLLGRGKGK